jgi:ureidoglycolate dehydrogenase (NAD+)
LLEEENMALEKIAGVRAAARDVEPFVAELFTAAGVNRESAEACARAVVDASARAYDTHGVRLIPFYMQGLAGGRINKTPTLTVTEKAASAVHVDADDGLGHYASYRAIDEAAKLAEKTGVAVATVGRSTHHGATGVYTRYAATKGFVAIGMTHADAMVIPHGGASAFFGTNPLSFAVPVEGEDPMVLDMATSSIPFNRVGLRRATGQPLPDEVAVDDKGEFTTDANAAVWVAPVGGADYGYKGSGLAGMVDLLCSAFTGMGHGKTMASFNGPDFSKPIQIGHFFIVLSPAVFQALSAFDARISDFLADLRAQPAKPGQKVYAPSDIEKGEAKKRAVDGIPVDNVTWNALEGFAAQYGVKVPAATADNG